jgi:EmrB/QacA subfamily drug resistance transporter
MAQQPVDYNQKWYVMAAVAMGIFLATIDGSIVNVALPTLVRGYDTDFAVVQWVVLAYLLTVTTLMLSMGRLGDMIGKKPLYAAGVIIFAIGSGLCGLAPTVYWLIAFRMLQAVGSAAIMALGTAILTEAFPPAERGKALGIGGAIVSIGIISGPVLGGLIINELSWNWIFFVNLPVGVVGFLMVLRFVPDIRPAGGQSFDFLGAGTLCITLLTLLLGLTFGQRIGFNDMRTLMLLAAFLGFLAAFIVIESNSAQPMIDLSLFRNQLFSVNLITGFISFVSIAGTIILIPFYLQNVLGYDPKMTGILMGVLPVSMGVAAPIAGWLSDRYGPRPIIVLGLLAMGIGYYAASTLTPATTALGYMLRFLPIGVGLGVFNAPNNSAIMGSVPRARLGVASGLLAITRTLGQTVGIAILGTVWAARVIYYAGGTLDGEVTSASAAYQVAALSDTYVVAIILIAIALALAIWGLNQERRGVTAPVVQPEILA